MPGGVVHTMEVFFVVEKSEVFSFLFTSFDIPCQIDNGNLEPTHYCPLSQKFQQ